MATTTRGSKALPPSKTPASPGMNEDLVEVKVSQEKLRTAHEEIVASVIEMKATQQDLAAAVKAIAGQLTDAVQLFQQGQSTVATGSNNNRGEDKKGFGGERNDGRGDARTTEPQIHIWHGLLLRHQARLLIPRRRTREDRACRRQIGCARGWPRGKHKAP